MGTCRIYQISRLNWSAFSLVHHLKVHTLYKTLISEDDKNFHNKDTMIERDYLMEEVYPALKDHLLREYGLEFQVARTITNFYYLIFSFNF